MRRSRSRVHGVLSGIATGVTGAVCGAGAQVARGPCSKSVPIDAVTLHAKNRINLSNSSLSLRRSHSTEPCNL